MGDGVMFASQLGGGIVIGRDQPFGIRDASHVGLLVACIVADRFLDPTNLVGWLYRSVFS